MRKVKFKTIAKIIGYTFLVLIGILGFYETNMPTLNTLNKWEEAELLRDYKSVLKSIQIPESSIELHSGIIRSGYYHIYSAEYKDTTNFVIISNFFQKELKEKGYKVTAINNGIVAAKDDYAIEVYKSSLNWISVKNKWFLEIRPNDFTVDGYLLLHSFDDEYKEY